MADALGSAANYLRRSGWITGAPWGHEIELPDGFDFSRAGRRQKRPLKTWAALGIKRADGGALEDDDRMAAVLLPAGATGPAFLVYKNFDVILRYNQAIHYALAIGHLADRMTGGEPFRQAWPKDVRPLKRREREELQELLSARGLSTGGIDGIIGPATRKGVACVPGRAGSAGRRLSECDPVGAAAQRAPARGCGSG